MLQNLLAAAGALAGYTDYIRKPSEKGQGTAPYLKLVTVTAPLIFIRTLGVPPPRPATPVEAVFATAIVMGSFLYSGYQVGQIAGEAKNVTR
jgi:hypothetical protein